MSDTQKKLFLGGLLTLIISFALYGVVASAVLAEEDSANLALGKEVTVTSQCNSCETFGENAVDGDPDTYWRALGSDETPTIDIDLGQTESWDMVFMHLNYTIIDEYTIFSSDDGDEWDEVYAMNVPPLDTVEEAIFDPVQARYVRVEFRVNEGAQPLLYEIEVYDPENPPADVLTHVYFSDNNREEYSTTDDIRLPIDTSHTLQVKGEMRYGSEANLAEAEVELYSTRPDVATIDENGRIQAVGDGVTKVHAVVEKGSAIQETEMFVVVEDLQENVIWDAVWSHPELETAIGQAAILEVGDDYPSLDIHTYTPVEVQGVLVDGEGNVVAEFAEQMAQGEEINVPIDGTAEQLGTYEMQATLQREGELPVTDTLYFTVQDPETMEADQSRVAYLGENGKLQYAPDYKGNHILDFSNSGYMGGGVPIPDVQARVVVEPAEGDDTARIQAAIDQVSAMPIQEDGFRGAVVLAADTYEVAGTLRIQSDGVVLRGQGPDEDGTLLYATGTERRNILEIEGTGGIDIDTDTRAHVQDLYVPSGARTFTVDDASDFTVGDSIIVRRFGNERWIREIDMDAISGGSGIRQWTPFELDFDREITAIDGNTITVDAPIANAIERRWGGGEVFAYTDEERIEQVGVENMRVEVEFDPTVIDNYLGQEEIYADENKAVSFVTMRNTKNAWVREVHAYHLEFGLTHIQRGVKQVTVQDSESREMVSRIGGSRRYPFGYTGELMLFQRLFAEDARHAFAIGAEVPGPNVFLDSVSENDYANSEPHHRWSVGGLYDNVHSQIAIQDRQSYGSGHGWAGANYVTWNTEGQLIAQSPPTAQTYAIGHVGERAEGRWPDFDDPRPREDAYWEHEGLHVNPQSLYRQQLQDRLGEEAVQHIERRPVGSPELDEPKTDHLLHVDLLYVDGVPLQEFDPHQYHYTVGLPTAIEDFPFISVESEYHVQITQAEEHNGTATVEVTDEETGRSASYTVQFIRSHIPDNLIAHTVDSVQASSDDGNVAENTLDGDLNTRWSAEGEQWIEYDLGETKPVSDMLLAFYRGDERQQIFDIDLSTDGEEWTTVFSGQGSGHTLDEEVFSFTKTPARYVRITGYGNTVNDWNSITTTRIAVQDAEELHAQMNGHIVVPDDQRLFGLPVNRLHIQSSWQVNAEGELEGQGQMHTTPRGTFVSIEDVEWINNQNDNLYIQWRGTDDDNDPYTVRMAMIPKEERLSVTIWEGDRAAGDAQAHIYSQSFQGNMSINVE